MRSFTKSITWKLHFWHAIILLCVIAGLSTAWFLQTQRARLSEIDSTLLAGARTLDGSLRGIRLPAAALSGNEAVTLSPNSQRRLSLPRENSMASENLPPMYFAIWLREGSLLHSSDLPKSVNIRQRPPHVEPSHTVSQRGPFREVQIIGPGGTQILVGRDITHELSALRQLAFRITGFSLGVFLVGLLGGYWLSRSVIQPIHDMSETAARFSVTNMSPRIDVGDTESELGKLAWILNEAFDRAEASFAQQRQFAADASHELRTPLAVIQSQIELALKRPRRMEEYVKALTICSTAEQRLSQLVESLLTLAGLDATDQSSKDQTIRLDQLSARCVDLIRPVAEQAKVEMRCSLQSTRIKGDREQLERAILNLLKNGITYNKTGGTLSISCVLQKNGEAVLTVRDTGIGISKKDLPRVTERFYRVDPARNREQGGSGLGLSIARKILEAHGVTLLITSVPDHGTTVTVTFPSAS